MTTITEQYDQSLTGFYLNGVSATRSFCIPQMHGLNEFVSVWRSIPERGDEFPSLSRLHVVDRQLIDKRRRIVRVDYA